ncbi:MAG: peptidoglycan editing factor PgeF [Candidatus Fonsibacter sp.]|nr:peptidoglycan editing factor PgeF [Candidatus Fonsibacter sp.]
MIFYSKKINKIPGLKSFFFSRKNGLSKGIYKSLNCGLGSNDKKIFVKNNIKIIAKKTGCKLNNLILLKQYHSNKIINFDNFLEKKRYKADGIITSYPKFSFGILTADCIPILVADKKNKTIAAIHSGWKGANSGIIENLIRKFKQKKSKISNLIVAIGPCISQKSYEVKEDFVKKIKTKNSDYESYFINNNKKIYFNLRLFVNNKFLKLKIPKKNIDHINKDTFSDHKNFFSYRRSIHNNESDYGRCISVICRY